MKGASWTETAVEKNNAKVVAGRNVLPSDYVGEGKAPLNAEVAYALYKVAETLLWEAYKDAEALLWAKAEQDVKDGG